MLLPPANADHGYPMGTAWVPRITFSPSWFGTNARTCGLFSIATYPILLHYR